jgi:hypothetical protein
MKWTVYGHERAEWSVEHVEADTVVVDEGGIAKFYKGTMVCDATLVLLLNRTAWTRIVPDDRKERP